MCLWSVLLIGWWAEWHVSFSFELINKLFSGDNGGMVVAVAGGKICILFGELSGLHANCCKGWCHNKPLLQGWLPPKRQKDTEPSDAPLFPSAFAAAL